MNCQEMEELLGAYALDALSEEEHVAADAHLAECPKCTNTLQQLRAIVELFPLSVPAIEPPPRLKAQILARIQEEEVARQPTLTIPVTPSIPRQTGQARQPAPRRNWRTALMAATILLLLILVGTSFAWNLSLRQQVAQLSASSPTLTTPIVYTLHGTGTGTGTGAMASGQLIYYAQQNITVLVLHDLPPINGTQVYQGWLLQDNKPTSIGLLNVQNGVATLDFQGNLSGYDAAAVSLEPGPQATSNAPKGPVVAMGTLK